MTNQLFKRSRYVHSALDRAEGAWIYQNLINRSLLEAGPADSAIIYKFLNEPNAEPTSAFEAEIRSLLIDRRFLVEENIDEISILEKRYWQQKTGANFASLAIVTTLQCNLRCEYCYQDHVDENISPGDEDNIVAFIRNEIGKSQSSSERLSKFSLSWWGGEPLLKIDAIERMSARIVPLLDEANITYDSYTSTNGVLLSKPNCSKLKTSRLSRVQITIDGPKEFHDQQRFNVSGRGTYDAILRGLYNLLDVFHEHERFVTLRVNVTPRMAKMIDLWTGFIDDLRPAASRIAVNVHQAIPNDFYTKQQSLENADYVPLYHQIRGMLKEAGFWCLEDKQAITPGALYCGAIPDHNWIILPGGRLTKCTDKFHDRTSDCGRIVHGGQLDLFPKAAEWLEYSPFKADLCRSCNVLPICMGGCRVIPFGSQHGDRCIRKTVIESSILTNPRRLTQAGGERHGRDE
ncbi:radical SAM/SPASM domain-containing protein [Rhodopseudomonas palustris]|uniref:radical SAM/SPASM domain-containing protein n=1 Tax=Rhodopseudomonas palustris TaxID=1076 RepID=UPI0011C4923D|nr:radical SAM protein [Rhodopseudomonas palustris]